MSIKNNNRVTVDSKLTAVSSKPVGPGKTHPLSTLDKAMELHTLHIIFYYRENLFGSFDWSPLRESLSEVLSLYPPVTGRLTRGENGNCEVKCNDAGVRVIRARVGTTVDEWLRSANGSQERDLTAWEDMPQEPSTWSSFRVQINDFEGGGVAIGLSCTHMLADPTCATLLFKAWAEGYPRKPIEYPPFFNPLAPNSRSVQNIHSKSATYYANKSKLPQTDPPLKMATATFKFSSSVIKKCLSEVHDKCPDATPFDLLAALFWTRVTRLKAPNKNAYTHSLSICIDFRKLLETPLPYGYFGNALHFSLLKLKEEELGDGEFGHVVESVHRHVSGIEEEEVWSVIDWLEAQKGEGEKLPPPFKMYGPELTCVNLEQMIVHSNLGERGNRSFMYKATFDKDVKPAHVSYHVGNVEGEGLIVVMPSVDEGLSRNVMVTLPVEELAEICVDQAILRLEPTMILSGKI